MHRLHEVGLLDHLLAVEVEVGVVEEEWVALGRRVLEVPALVAGEPLGLTVDAEVGVVRGHHVVRGVAPGGGLLDVGAELGRDVRVSHDRVGGLAQVPLGHEVRVDVVVGDRCVLVRAGDSVDPEVPVLVVVAEGAPKARGLDQELDAARALEVRVVDRILVAGDRVGDVGVDVEGRRSRRPVRGALLPGDRPPGEGGAAQAELLRAGAREVEDRVAPREGVADRVRRRIREDGQDERVRVPEGVTVVARAGESLCRGRALLGPGGGLQAVEHGEPDRKLELGVAVDLDVGAGPVVVQVLAMAVDQSVPARMD